MAIEYSEKGFLLRIYSNILVKMYFKYFLLSKNISKSQFIKNILHTESYFVSPMNNINKKNSLNEK